MTRCYEALYIHNKMFVLFFKNIKKYLYYFLINFLNYFILQYHNNYIRTIK